MDETRTTIGHRAVRSLILAGVGAVAGPVALLVFAYQAFHSGMALTVAALTGAVVGGVCGAFVEDAEWRELLDLW
jgi:outer membrane lipoprotein SlyB